MTLSEELIGVFNFTLFFPQYLITATGENQAKYKVSNHVVSNKNLLLVGAVSVSQSRGSNGMFKSNILSN